MSKGKALGLTVVLVVIILGAGFFYLGFNTNLLASGTYYTKIDNAHVAENDSAGDVIHLKSSESFVYQLHAANEDGHEIEASFGAAHELRQDAYLKLNFEPLRGVVYWEEISPEDLPSKAADVLAREEAANREIASAIENVPDGSPASTNRRRRYKTTPLET